MLSITRRLSSALETSIVVATIRDLRDKSALINQLARAIELSEDFYVSETKLATAWESSRVGTLTNIVSGWCRGSALYQWLTSEPDPSVVVIDLRDTVIISPFLSIFDKTIQTLSSSISSTTPDRNE